MQRIEEIQPVAILTTPQGDTVLDMGQNMVGWLRLKVQGPAGATVTLRHIEVLDRDGNVYTDNLRRALQTNSYTCKGQGLEVYEPRFTFQGFRYVVVKGYPGELTLDSLTGVVVHSQMDVTRRFQHQLSAAQPTAAQHSLGPKGQLCGCAHRLPPARRAPRLAGRRTGVHPHGGLQYGCGRVFHQMAGRPGRRSARRRQPCLR